MAYIFKKINTKLISPLIMMCVIAALLIFSAFTFAWFSESRHAVASGFSINVTDKRITLSDTITVTRTLSSRQTTETFMRGEGAVYYLYENGEFVLDEDGEMIPFSVAGLLPGETVDVTFSYTCTDSLIGSGIRASLSQITADAFNELEHPDVAHSVLGVYKYSVMTDGAFGEEAWMVEYASGVDDDMPDYIPLFENNVWEKVSETPSENYTSVTFRFDFDLAQYSTLKTATNQLSEKSFSIGELRIEVANEE